jgi:hypothetical protein
MTDWAFNVIFVLVTGFLIFNGIFMLAAPAKHRCFLARISRADFRSQAAPEALDKKNEIERRLAGAGLAAMGIYLAYDILSSAWSMNNLQTNSPQGTPHLGTASFSLIIGGCLLIAGILIAARPDLLVRWSLAQQPNARSVPDSTLAKWKIGARLLGLALILGGVHTLFIAVSK